MPPGGRSGSGVSGMAEQVSKFVTGLGEKVVELSR